MKNLLLAAAMAASLAVALSLISAAQAGCPSYDPNCGRPCPPGNIC